MSINMVVRDGEMPITIEAEHAEKENVVFIKYVADGISDTTSTEKNLLELLADRVHGHGGNAKERFIATDFPNELELAQFLKHSQIADCPVCD